MHFSQGEPALMVKYETLVPIGDVTRLGLEADEVWAHFSPDADRAGLRNGILAATTPSTGGIITTSQGYNFVFVKSQEGTWRRRSAK